LGDHITQAPQQDNHEPAGAEQSSLQEKTPAPASYPPRGLSLSNLSSPDDIPLTRNNLLFLQRTIGNRAVVRLVQRKAKISQPGDEYEREADRVADQVMTATHQPARQNMAPDDKQEVQTKSLASTITPLLRRQAMPEEETRKRREEETVQTKEQSGTASDERAPQGATQISNPQSGEGEPLTESVRAYFEPRFGQDFGDVRVHKGSQAAASARAINARAYTSGRNVAFGAGEYSPGTTEGKRLIAHELAHVVQQTGSDLSIRSKPQADVQRDDDNKAPAPGSAKERAKKIYDALHGSIWSEDEEGALDQIRGQSTGMLLQIKAEYSAVSGGSSLTGDFRSYLDTGQYKEALTLLYPVLTVEERLLTFDYALSENEAGMLEVLRHASRDELNLAAQSAKVTELLQASLNAKEYFEAQKLLTPDKLYGHVVQWIENAKGTFDDDEDSVYNAILELPIDQRQKLWDEHGGRSGIFSFLEEEEYDSVKILCLGTEAAALTERLRLATSGAGTEDEDVQMVIAKTKSAAEEEKALKDALKTGKTELGKPLTPEQLTSVQLRLQQLGGIQENLLTVKRDGEGEIEENSFLGLLHGDVSEEEFYAFAGDIGVTQFEIAKQKILDALGTFNDDEESIYKAFDRLVGDITVPLGEDAKTLTPERRAELQQEANRKLRQSLLADEQIKEALAAYMSEDEMKVIDEYAAADTYQIALRKLQDAYSGVDTDEEEIFRLLVEMKASDRKKLKAEKPPIYYTLTQGFWLTEQEIKIINAVIDTGKIPTGEAMSWAFGGGWDGTEEEMLDLVFPNMDDEERHQYRLGYYLYKGGAFLDTEKFDRAKQQEALDKFRELYQRMVGELTENELQKALDQLLGIPTLDELMSEEGRRMSVEIMRNRVAEKGDIRERDKVSSGIMDTFGESGEVSDLAEVQFETAYMLALADNKLSEEEFYMLVALDANFAKKYDDYVATVKQVQGIAGTVAAVAAGIVVIALSGGSGAPAVVAALGKAGITVTATQAVAITAVAAGTAGGAARVGASELIGGSHYDAASTEGLRDAAVGFAEGAAAVLSASLAARFMNVVGLGKEALAGELAAGIVTSSDAAISLSGRTFATAGLKNAIEGLLAGAAGGVVMTVTDQAVWKKTIWEVIGSIGAALLREAGIGAVTGFVVGGTLEALGAYVGVKRVQSLIGQLAAAGIPEERLSRMSINAVKAIGRADAALLAGQMEEAEKVFKVLTAELGPDEAESVQRALLKNYAGRPGSSKAISTMLAVLEIPRRPHVEDAYSPIRNITDGSDIKQIAKATGFPPEEVAAAKQHFMFDEHILVDNETGELFRGRFEAYPEDAARWLSVARGETEHVPYLRRLLLHEHTEASILRGEKRLLYDKFASGELENHLVTYLKTQGVEQSTIDNMLKIDRPITPYKYAHLRAHYSGAPNP
jgi:hypothetical protein